MNLQNSYVFCALIFSFYSNKFYLGDVNFVHINRLHISAKIDEVIFALERERVWDSFS